MPSDCDSSFLSEIKQVEINETAIDEQVHHIRSTAFALEGSAKRAWLLKAIGFIDLTTLAGNDTAVTVKALCAKAVNPVTLGSEKNEHLHVAAVCVYPSRIKDAKQALEELDPQHQVAVASVAGGFPSGQYPLETRLREVDIAIEMGATEIDIVIDRSLAITHNWEELLSELQQFSAHCSNGTCLKTILSTGELLDLKDVYIASMIAMRAGANFIKTSTGKEAVNATLPVGIVMCRAIKDYYKMTQRKVGFKPAGGIKTVQDVLGWMILVEMKLGNEWLTKDLFRIGASSLLDSITAELTKE